MTSAELKMKGHLDDFGVEYEYQSVIRGFLCDFFIPSKKIVIEADGDYWHGNEKIFPVLTPLQLKNIDIRNRKRSAMKWIGVRLIEVWESEMTDSDVIERLRRDVCG